jgi:hypothetical protein
MEPNDAASAELVRWRLREREVEAVLRETESEELRLSEELAKVDEQAGYYDSLAGDMKRDVQPPSLYGLIRSLRW